MAKKRGKERDLLEEIDEVFERVKQRKHYPYSKIGFAKGKILTDNEKAFILLAYCGMPRTKAYRVAFKSDATSSSIQAMASRLIQEPWVEETFRHLKQGKPWWRAEGWDFKEWG